MRGEEQGSRHHRMNQDSDTHTQEGNSTLIGPEREREREREREL